MTNDFLPEYFGLIEKMRCYRELMRDFGNGCSSHAYMLCGNDGELLYSLALIIGCAALCGSAPPCFKCRTCRNVLSGVHTDVHPVPAGDGRINVEEAVRIIDGCQLKPMEGERQVFILKRVSEMLPAAQNKLLKILEEPPAGVIFVLLVQNESAVLPTIKSRTVQITVPRPSPEDIYSFLAAKFSDGDKCRAMAVVSDGSVSLAEKMMAGEDFYGMYEDMFRMFIGFDHSSKILSRVGLLMKYEKNFEDALGFMQIVLRDVLMLKTQPELVLDKHRTEELKAISALYPQAALIAAIELVDDARKRLRFNCGKKAVADNLLIGILEVRRKCLL